MTRFLLFVLAGFLIAPGSAVPPAGETEAGRQQREELERRHHEFSQWEDASADSRYAVVPVEGNPYFQLSLIDRVTGEELERLGGAYSSYRYSAENAMEDIQWQGEKPLLAVNVATGRYGSHLRLIDLASGKPVELRLPDFVQNVLGQLDSLETHHHHFYQRLHWVEDQLHVRASFNAKDPETGGFLTDVSALAVINCSEDRPQLVELDATCDPQLERPALPQP